MTDLQALIDENMAAVRASINKMNKGKKTKDIVPGDPFAAAATVRKVSKGRPTKKQVRDTSIGGNKKIDPLSIIRRQNEQRAARQQASKPGTPGAQRALEAAKREINDINEQLEEDSKMIIFEKMKLQNRRSLLVGSLPTLRSEAYRERS